MISPLNKAERGPLHPWAVVDVAALPRLVNSDQATTSLEVSFLARGGPRDEEQWPTHWTAGQGAPHFWRSIYAAPTAGVASIPVILNIWSFPEYLFNFKFSSGTHFLKISICCISWKRLGNYWLLKWNCLLSPNALNCLLGWCTEWVCLFFLKYSQFIMLC